MGCQASMQTKEELMTKFNKDFCKAIYGSLPIREETDLQKFKQIIKEKSMKCSQKEKFYIMYLWICENIDFDINSAGKFINCSPEFVFKNGKTICTGFARLFQNIAAFLELNVKCVKCFTKGNGYEPGNKLKKLNHEYNLIKN